MKKGIDISKYQNGINFELIKNSKDFVILRGGYTTNGSIRLQKVDPLFKTFYARCKELNIPVGVYFYSCATSYNQGQLEAEFLYNNVLKGRQFEYPIYIDVEDNYHLKAGREAATLAIIGFCEFLESKGYYAGYYTGLSFLNNNLNYSKLKRFTMWLAAWQNIKPVNYANMHIWQYTSTGKIGKITVDRNKCYINNFPGIMKKKGLNGYEQT